MYLVLCSAVTLPCYSMERICISCPPPHPFSIYSSLWLQKSLRKRYGTQWNELNYLKRPLSWNNAAGWTSNTVSLHYFGYTGKCMTGLSATSAEAVVRHLCKLFTTNGQGNDIITTIIWKKIWKKKTLQETRLSFCVNLFGSPEISGRIYNHITSTI